MRALLLVTTTTACAAYVAPSRTNKATALRAVDADVLRQEFPALKQKSRGHDLVYFDSGATSQKPQSVLDATTKYYEEDNANVHRGAHDLAQRATDAYEGARDIVAKFINAFSRNEVVWTRGATEAINLVAHAWGDAYVSSGDEIVLSALEHHSNLVPWQLLSKRTGCTIKYAPLNDKQEQLDTDKLLELITPQTKVVALCHVSNVLGCVAPVPQVVEKVRRVAPEAIILLDACQSAPHTPLDVQKLGVDFVAFSGHKMCGPTGIGVLWGLSNRLEEMRPWQGGGEMIGDVFLDDGVTTYAAPPARFEAGTPPIAEAVGLGAACEFLSEVGMDSIADYEKQLGAKLYEGLAGFGDRIRIVGPPPSERGAALCAFTCDGVHSSDLAFFLDQEGVAVRAGHHCTQPLHKRLGADGGTVRASLALYNTEAEVEAFLAALDRVLADLEDDSDFVPLDL